MADTWKALTALGHDAAETTQIGPFKLVERCDVALASLAMRRGQDGPFAAAAAKAGLPLPAVARHQTGTPYSAFWVSPEMWFVEADFATHQDIAVLLKSQFADAASITEQTDAWVRIDVAGQGLEPLFARLTNLDLPMQPDGYASRTVIEHLGVYLVKHRADLVTLYGPRSSAQSLWHALEITAKSVI